VVRGSGVVGSTQQTLEYDGLSRPTRLYDDNDPLNPADDSLVVTVYDSLSRVIEHAQNGKVISAGWLGRERRKALTYPNGRLSRVIEQVQNGKVISAGWLGRERRKALTYPNGRRLELTYDKLDRLKTVRDAGASMDLGAAAYIGPQRMLERRMQNGVRLTYLDDAGGLDTGYDAVKRIVAQRHIRSDNSLVSGVTHMWDRSYNRSSEEKLHSPESSELYRYDSMDRLTRFDRGTLTADKGGVVGTPLYSREWVLDGTGNWRIHSLNGAPESRSVNKMNEYTSIGVTPKVRDATGNRRCVMPQAIWFRIV
jgi:hypothetical protein